MAGGASNSGEMLASTTLTEKTRWFALISLTSLFFMWGFLTVLNDILIPYLKELFELSFFEAMLVQFCFFGAYAIVSYPAGKLVSRIGYQSGIVLGLTVAAAGCALFYPAAGLAQYWIFLLALFILAAGITILQVSANPYVSVLGKPETASSRLTMTQAFNSLGTTVGPIFGAALILSVMGSDENGATATAAEHAAAVQVPYLGLAAALLILGIIFAFIKLPRLGVAEEVTDNKATEGSAWNYRHLVLGAVGIFAYVGAEVGIGSFLANFIALDEIGNMDVSQAAHYISWYFGGAMVGRFIGAVVMQYVNAGKVLAFNAVMAIVLVFLAMTTEGQFAMWSLLFVGLFNSIMFPTIFSLAVTGLGKHTSQGSGILCVAIVGGAIVPPLQGHIADLASIQAGFLIPIVCYAFIVFYGLKGSKPVEQDES